MIEVIFKIFLTDYIDFQGFITKRIQKPLLIEYICFLVMLHSLAEMLTETVVLIDSSDTDWDWFYLMD
jgi:hypothetical protein